MAVVLNRSCMCQEPIIVTLWAPTHVCFPVAFTTNLREHVCFSFVL